MNRRSPIGEIILVLVVTSVFCNSSASAQTPVSNPCPDTIVPAELPEGYDFAELRSLISRYGIDTIEKYLISWNNGRYRIRVGNEVQLVSGAYDASLVDECVIMHELLLWNFSPRKFGAHVAADMARGRQPAENGNSAEDVAGNRKARVRKAGMQTGANVRDQGQAPRADVGDTPRNQDLEAASATAKSNQDEVGSDYRMVGIDLLMAAMYLISIVLTGVLAYKKNYSPVKWTLISFVLPFISTLYIFIVGQNNDTRILRSKVKSRIDRAIKHKLYSKLSCIISELAGAENPVSKTREFSDHKLTIQGYSRDILVTRAGKSTVFKAFGASKHKSRYSSGVVHESYEIASYVPGDWENHVESLYRQAEHVRAEREKRESEELGNEMKKRFGF